MSSESRASCAFSAAFSSLSFRSVARLAPESREMPRINTTNPGMQTNRFKNYHCSFVDLEKWTRLYSAYKKHIPRLLGRLTKMHLRDRGARSRCRNARRGGVGARTVRGAEAAVAVGRRVGAVASAVGREGRRRHRRHHRRRHHRGRHHRSRHHRLLHDRHRVRHGDVAVHGHLTDDRARNRNRHRARNLLNLLDRLLDRDIDERLNLARDRHGTLDDLLHRHVHELLHLVRHLHRHVNVLVDDLRDVDRALHRLDLRHLHRNLNDLLDGDIHNLRHRDLADLLNRLNLDLGHVHVARERDILDLHAGDVADHLLHVRDLDRHILDLDLRHFHLLVHSLDLDAPHLANDLLHLDLGDVADHFLDLGNLHDNVLDLHLRHLNHALNGLDLHTRDVAVDDLRLHARHGALHHMRDMDVDVTLRSHHLGAHPEAADRTAETTNRTEHCECRELNFRA